MVQLGDCDGVAAAGRVVGAAVAHLGRGEVGAVGEVERALLLFLLLLWGGGACGSGGGGGSGGLVGEGYV